MNPPSRIVRARSILTSMLAVCLLSASEPTHPADDYSWRASVTSERARQVAGELFPDKCGGGGSLCGITFDDRRACPFEFVVQFPVEKRNAAEPALAYVTLDKGGAVVDVSSSRKVNCRSATS